MARWRREYDPSSGNTIDLDLLQDELNKGASTHNNNDEIYSGKKNLVFESGYKVRYDSVDFAYGKFVRIHDSSTAVNNVDTGDVAIGALTDITFDATCTAFSGAEKANAVRLGITFYPAPTKGGTIYHPARSAGVDTDYEFCIGHDGFSLTDAHHLYPIANDVDRSIAAGDAVYAEAIIYIANTNNRKIQYWAGTRTVAADGSGVNTDSNINLRLIGYYV